MQLQTTSLKWLSCWKLTFVKLLFFFTFLLYRNYTQAQAPCGLVFDQNLHSQSMYAGIMPLTISDFANSANPPELIWHEAFKCAATFINQRGGKVKLYIPAMPANLGGVYTIGKQNTITSKLRKGENVFQLNNVLDVEIVGDFDPNANKPTTILRYNPNLFFRHVKVDPPNSGIIVCEPSLPTYTNYYTADLGNAIDLNNCTNVKIENVTIDGNIRPGGICVGGNSIIFGGTNQTIHDGIVVTSSFNTNINRVECNYLGLDGIRINNKTATPTSPCNTVITNTKCLYNARQGLTLNTGHGIRIENCNFDSTGKIYDASPRAGCDLETDNEGDLSNVTFTNCTFDNNAGYGLIAYYTSTTPWPFDYIKKVTLNSCRMASYFSLSHHYKEFKFNNCQIRGDVNGGHGNTDPILASQFNACAFSDCNYYYQQYGNQNITPTPPVKINIHSADPTDFDIYMENIDNAKFNKCRFDNFYGKMAQFWRTAGQPFNIECNNTYFSNFVQGTWRYNVNGLVMDNCIFEMPPWQGTWNCYYNEPLFMTTYNTNNNPNYNAFPCNPFSPPRTCTSYENAHPNFCYNQDFFRGTNQIYIDNLLASDIGGDYYSNAYFFVNGIFTIDKDMTFDNCRFFFTAGAKVVVNTNKVITFNNSTLKGGCNACWDGFTATNMNTQVILNSCVVQDVMPIINSLTGTNLTCNGNNSGTAAVNPVNLPANMFNYSWMPGGSNVQTATNLSAGTYTVTVSSGASCSVTSSITLTQPNALTWNSLTSTNVTCGNTNNGTITASAGTGTIGYNIQPTNTMNTTGFLNNLVANTYTITASTSTSCTFSVVTIYLECSLTATVFIEGYYLGSSLMKNVYYNSGVDPNPSNNVDFVTLELHDVTNTATIVWSATTMLLTNGKAVATIPSSLIGNSYYLVVKHKNSVQVWSSTPITISIVTDYNFTDLQSKTYGSNSVDVFNENIYSAYSGDLNQDESVDAIDFVVLDPDLILGNSGYLVTDINGDGSVDALDFIILEPNLIAGITAYHP